MALAPRRSAGPPHLPGSASRAGGGPDGPAAWITVRGGDRSEVVRNEPDRDLHAALRSRCALPPTASPAPGQRAGRPRTRPAYLGDVVALLDHATRMRCTRPGDLDLTVLRSWLPGCVRSRGPDTLARGPRPPDVHCLGAPGGLLTGMSRRAGQPEGSARAAYRAACRAGEALVTARRRR